VPETPSKTCHDLPFCPVYKIWTALVGHKLTLWEVVQKLDRDRAKELAKRIEWEEPQRSSIDVLAKENAALRGWKRRAELFLLSNGLSLPDD
jgi:hypothetical protein